MSPLFGTGTTQTFSVVYNDPAGNANLKTTQFLFGPNSSGVNACSMVYDRANNAISLMNDAGNGLAPGSVTPGVGGTAVLVAVTVGEKTDHRFEKPFIKTRMS